MMMIDGLKQDVEYDLREHDGNGTCSAILGTGLVAAAAAVGIASIATWNNPFCWVALNFKKFVTTFVVTDAAVSATGVAVAKGVSASMKKENSVMDEDYEEFESMINRGRHIEFDNDTIRPKEKEREFVTVS